MLLRTIFLAAASLANAAPVVQLGQTTVTGTLSSLTQSVETFRGIPYASPPVGSLRFQPPVLQTSLDASEFNATSSGPPCLQQGVATSAEDCLHLDIYRPAGYQGGPLPVLVWIYGGGFTSGSTSAYDLSLITAKSVARGTPIIAVAINYRLVLAQFGFPQGDEAASRNAVNVGLKDQLAALQWIQANIGPFGGDKDKVTASGESAGAHSLDVHLHGTALQGLVRAVIADSTYTQPIRGVSDGNADWATFVKAIPECASTADSGDTLSCLQSLDSSAFADAINAGGSFQPIIDGPDGLIPNYISQLELKTQVPLLLGSNLDEGTLFVPTGGIPSAAYLRAYLIAAVTPSPRGADALSKAIDTILQLYPDIPALGSPYDTGNETFGLPAETKRFSAIFGDLVFHSRVRALSVDSQKHSNPTFVYHFTDHSVIPRDANPAALGVTHGNELFYLSYLGPPAAWNITSAESLQLADQMQDYWLSFVTTLNPNDGKGSQRELENLLVNEFHTDASKGPQWVDYSSSDSQTLLQLDGKNLTLAPDNFREEQINFINSDQLVYRK